MNKRGAGGVEETLQQSFLSKGLKSEEEDTTTNHGLIFHIVAATEPKTLFSCKDHAT